MAKATKIESSLTAAQEKEFLSRLMEMTNPTLAAIQTLALEYQITVSLEGARTYKKNVYQREIGKLQAAQQLALQVASVQESGAGHSLADASRSLIAQIVFEQLSQSDGYDPEQGIDLLDLSLIVKRISDSDQNAKRLSAQLRESELKVSEYQAKEKEARLAAEEIRRRMAKEQSSGKGLSDETLRIIEQKVGLL